MTEIIAVSELRPITELEKYPEDRRVFEIAMRAYSHHSDHLPNDKEFEKMHDKYMFFLLKLLGYEYPKSVNHTHVEVPPEGFNQ